MDIHSSQAELRSEKERLQEAILTIERLAASSLGRRRGRPPKWLANVKADLAPSPASKATAPKKRRKFSAATRKKMAEAQRKRWASRKATAEAA
jgi:hypothetical protein